MNEEEWDDDLCSFSCDVCGRKIQKNERYTVIVVSEQTASEEDSGIHYDMPIFNVCRNCGGQEFIFFIVVNKNFGFLKYLEAALKLCLR